MAESRTRPRLWSGASMVGSLAILWACSNATPDQPSKSSAPEAPSVAAASAVAQAPATGRTGAVPTKFRIDTFLQPDRPLQAGDYVWDAAGAPDAPLHVVADIAAQRLYVYRGSVEIGRSSLIYGADDKPTPTGSFPILEKDKDHESNLYDAAMPYMLRLTWDGVAIHGSEVEEWAATNGCIGVPDEFAALLFDQVKVGDKVLVTNDWMVDIYGA